MRNKYKFFVFVMSSIIQINRYILLLNKHPGCLCRFTSKLPHQSFSLVNCQKCFRIKIIQCYKITFNTFLIKLNCALTDAREVCVCASYIFKCVINSSSLNLLCWDVFSQEGLAFRCLICSPTYSSWFSSFAAAKLNNKDANPSS